MVAIEDIANAHNDRHTLESGTLFKKNEIRVQKFRTTVVGHTTMHVVRVNFKTIIVIGKLISILSRAVRGISLLMFRSMRRNKRSG